MKRKVKQEQNYKDKCRKVRLWELDRTGGGDADRILLELNWIELVDMKDRD